MQLDYYLLVKVFQEVFQIFQSWGSNVVVRRESQGVAVFIGVNHINTNFLAASFQNLNQLQNEKIKTVALPSEKAQ